MSLENPSFEESYRVPFVPGRNHKEDGTNIFHQGQHWYETPTLQIRMLLVHWWTRTKCSCRSNPRFLRHWTCRSKLSSTTGCQWWSKWNQLCGSNFRNRGSSQRGDPRLSGFHASGLFNFPLLQTLEKELLGHQSAPVLCTMLWGWRDPHSHCPCSSSNFEDASEYFGQ